MTEAEFQEFLDAISTCFITHDFAAWEARIRMPFSMVTKDGPLLLEDRAALRTNFDHYLTACAAMKLDQIVRTPHSLEDCNDGCFIGTYETELLSHGHRATAPYTSSILLHPSDTGWRMSSIMNARGHHEWTGRSPRTERQS